MERIKFANWIKESRKKGIEIAEYKYFFSDNRVSITIYAPEGINFSLPEGAENIHLSAINKLCIVVFSVELTGKTKKNKKK